MPNSDSESSDGELASKIADILEQVRLRREPPKKDLNLKGKIDAQAKRKSVINILFRFFLFEIPLLNI